MWTSCNVQLSILDCKDLWQAGFRTPNTYSVFLDGYNETKVINVYTSPFACLKYGKFSPAYQFSQKQSPGNQARNGNLFCEVTGFEGGYQWGKLAAWSHHKRKGVLDKPKVKGFVDATKALRSQVHAANEMPRHCWPSPFLCGCVFAYFWGGAGRLYSLDALKNFFLNWCSRIRHFNIDTSVHQTAVPGSLSLTASIKREERVVLRNKCELSCLLCDVIAEHKMSASEKDLQQIPLPKNFRVNKHERNTKRPNTCCWPRCPSLSVEPGDWISTNQMQLECTCRSVSCFLLPTHKLSCSADFLQQHWARLRHVNGDSASDVRHRDLPPLVQWLRRGVRTFTGRLLGRPQHD